MEKYEPEKNNSRIVRLVRFIVSLTATVIGSFSWSPPTWLRTIRNKVVHNKVTAKISSTRSWIREHPRQFRIVVIGIIALCVSIVIGYNWYLSLPQKIKFTISGTVPSATKLDDILKPDPLHINFSGSAARMDHVGKPITQGIGITPPIEGEWRWVTDSQLTFTPKVDWAVGQKYTVSLDRSLFPNHVYLKDYEYKFESAPFTASILKSEFYQDPTNPKIKKVVATIQFSHQVDSEDFEKRIVMRMADQKEGFLGIGAESYSFTVSYDKFKGEAYIHSTPVAIPLKDTYMVLSIAASVKSARGGAPTKEKLEQRVEIPGMYNFFRIRAAELSLVRNELYEPEQVLVVQTTDGVLESEIQKNLNVYLLPQDLPAMQGKPAIKNYQWYDTGIIGPEVLNISTHLKLEPLLTDKEYATLHSFKYKMEPGKYLYIKVTKGTQSYGGYVLAKEFDVIKRVPEFPKELKIMYDGAILSLSGEKKVSVLSRDVEAIRFEIGRVVPSQINHLVSQSSGQFRSPYFDNYHFNEDNISERFSEIRELKQLGHGKTQYSAFDLSSYLTPVAGSNTKRGLFFFKIESWDPVHKRSTGIRDNRLILVTDLGLVVKDNVDGSHDLFVQSIYKGTPVADVKVEVIGKNGLPILHETTDGKGHVSFPSLTGFEREKSPTVYLVTKDDNLSFLPYNRDERKLNLSRFDIGGIVTAGAGERLNAYLFSDRGIYRPGDEFSIGMIVKASDWAQNLTGVPLETIITDARGLEVQKRKITLSAAGFEEIRYQTEETSPTGNYQASVYIIKDGYRGNLLGSTTVRVEEFLPDRMKINTRLSQEAAEGWVSPTDLKGLVTLKNLFGTPAQGRRISAMITLLPAYPVFRSYKDYTFFDPLYAKHTFSERLKDEQTNEKGEAEFALGLERFDKATYHLNFLAEGYEAAGGRGVSSESSILISPLPYIIGYKPDGDLRYINKGSSRSIEMIAINSAMKKIAVSNLKTHITEQRYVSVLTRQSDDTFKYESVRKEIPVSKKELSFPEQGLHYSLPTDQPGDYVLIIRDNNDTELNRIEFSIVGRANLTRTLEKNAELQIKLNKSDYAIGEYIEMQIKAPYVGAGLITIERDRIYGYEWFKTNTTSSVQRIRVPNNLEGNGYVHVTFVRAMESPEIFMSPLSYGVMPFSVSREKRTNPVDIESPDLARPGEPYRIRYKSQKPGKIVVFAVDEGILQVANYHTPDPLAHFFKKKALEVKTAQILDLVLPEFKLIKELSSPGGDEEAKGLGKNLNPFRRKRDKPAAYWSGIVDVDSTPRELVYSIPDYFNGTLRVMAVAVSPDSIGIEQKKAFVRGHFVLSPNVPAFAAPGDEFEVSVGVANNIEGSGKEPEIKLELKTSEHLEILGETNRILKIGEGRETNATFKIRTKRMLGSGNLTFTASLEDKKSGFSVDMSIRPPTPFMTTVAAGYFKSGKVDVPVTRKMHQHYRTLQASASPLPLGLARGLVDYLNKFPYGCTEQLVSQAFPAIALRDRPEFGYLPDRIESNLEQVAHILRARQNAEGAFGFWAANSHVSDFQTVYALHFLTEAKEKGYPMPPDLLNKGLIYLRNLLGNNDGETLSDLRVRSYAVYILTRNGIITTNYLNTVRTQLDTRYAKRWKKDLAGIYLAAAYKLLKQDSQAETIISGTQLGDAQETDYANYYDNLVRDAQYLYIVSLHFPEHLESIAGDGILHIVKPIMENRFNTISSAYTILALDAYTRVAGAPKPDNLAMSESLPGGKYRELKVPSGLFPAVDFSDAAEQIRIASKSSYNTFYQVTQAGFDLALPQAEIKQKLEVQREYRDEKGNVLTKTRLGSEIEVYVKFRSIEGAGLRNIAIVDLLPGGFEAVPDDAGHNEAQPYEDHDVEQVEKPEQGEHDGGEEASLLSTPAMAAQSAWRPDYVDIREDRVIFFGSADSNVHEFVYRIKATNKGDYAIPPAFGESMYDRTVQARGLGGKFTVEGK